MKFDHAEQSLKTQFFKVSRSSDFNDPFECRGRIANVEVQSWHKGEDYD